MLESVTRGQRSKLPSINLDWYRSTTRLQAGSISMNPATHLKLRVKGFDSIQIIIHNLANPVAAAWIAIQPPALSCGPRALRFQPPISFLSPRRSFLIPAPRHVPAGDDKCHAPQSCNLPLLKHPTRIDRLAQTLVETNLLGPRPLMLRLRLHRPAP